MDLRKLRKSADDASLRDRAVAASRSGIIITDPNLPGHPIVYVNHSFERITGYTADEVVGRSCSFLQGSERDQPALDELRTALREGWECRVTLRNFRKDGSPFWNELTISPMHDEDGRIANFVGVQNDVTELILLEESLRERGELFRTLVQSVSDIVVLADDEGTILYENPAVEHVLGYRPNERVGRSGLDHVHPDDLERVKESLAAASLTAGFHPPVECRVRHADGSWRYIETIRNNLLDDPRIKGMVNVTRDITDRKRAEERLRASEERLRRLADSAFEGIVIHEGETILEANEAYAEMHGCGLSEMVGASVLEWVAPEERALMRERILAGYEEPYEIVGMRMDGSRLHLEVRGRAFDYRGRPVRVTALRDVTERKALERRLEKQAYYDPLTGLPNRRLFMNRIEYVLAGIGRRGGVIAVLFLDLDGFKAVNDGFGHEAGDTLLRLVSERLGGCLRPEDTLARMGGDEFAVLLQDVIGPDDATGVAERMAGALAEPFDLGEQELHTSASIGISLSEPGRSRSDRLLRDADTAMYRSKGLGRAGYQVFDPSMYDGVGRRMRLRDDLRIAVKREELEVHYQPQFDLRTGGVYGVEALIRWNHPEYGLILPSELVPIAEESGLIVPIGWWLLKEACRQARLWHLEHPDAASLALSVNPSVRQLRQSDAAWVIEQTLQETGLDAGYLNLDLTEPDLMELIETYPVILERLGNLGSKLAIDDFGRRHLSFSQLKRFPVRTLKVDGSLVGWLGAEDEDTAIMQVVIDLAHALGMVVIAKGVETEDQASRVRATGCDLAQGHYFAEPMPGEAVAEFLRSRRT